MAELNTIYIASLLSSVKLIYTDNSACINLLNEYNTYDEKYHMIIQDILDRRPDILYCEAEIKSGYNNVVNSLACLGHTRGQPLFMFLP